MMNEYIFRDLKTKKEKNELTDFLRHQTTAEYGGNQIFDGTRSHIMHNPEELSEFIYFLKNYEQKKKRKIKSYLEIGYSSGKVNTILNKFFNFEHITAVDNFMSDISSTDLLANLRRKNLTLVCRNSDKEKTSEIVKKFQPYDLIFIDGSHEYNDAKNDLNNFYKMLSDFGVLAVHDIHSRDYPGVNKAWKEFKQKKNFRFKEISHKKYFFNCGMGLAAKKF